MTTRSPARSPWPSVATSRERTPWPRQLRRVSEHGADQRGATSDQRNPGSSRRQIEDACCPLPAICCSMDQTIRLRGEKFQHSNRDDRLLRGAEDRSFFITGAQSLDATSVGSGLPSDSSATCGSVLASGVEAPGRWMRASLSGALSRQPSSSHGYVCKRSPRRPGCGAVRRMDASRSVKLMEDDLSRPTRRSIKSWRCMTAKEVHIDCAAASAHRAVVSARNRGGGLYGTTPPSIGCATNLPAQE